MNAHAVAAALSLTALGAHAGLCESGQRQSPINITSAQVAPQKAPAMQVDYRAEPLKLANDGHTLRVRFARGGLLTLGRATYRLQQFHFHTPGGDQINGENFPFAAHMLHKSASGGLLSVVVPFRLGAQNALLEPLLARIPAQADGDHAYPEVMVDARQLLPASLGYYSYSGSLTAAPCTEGVQWLVMKQPQTLSAEQLARWRAHFADNMRGVNPAHGRAVFETP